MTAKIILDNIVTSSTPALFTDQIGFEVTFTALQPTLHPLCWKITYVGSAYSQDYDQTLEQFEIDPIGEAGTMKFDIVCQCPDSSKIPRKQLLSVTALLITASYNSQQFIRVGYYVHNQMALDQGLGQGSDASLKVDDMPLQVLTKKIRRTIISDKPRVTKFNIKWDVQESNKSNSNSHVDELSQSKLQDYFWSKKGEKQNQQVNIMKDSSQQKDIDNKFNENLNQKLSTHEESELMLAQ